MEIVEREEGMGKMEIEDAWRPGIPIENDQCLTPQYSRRTSYPGLFDHSHVHHIQIGYTHASPPGYARRPTHVQFEYPKASQQPTQMVQSLTEV